MEKYRRALCSIPGRRQRRRRYRSLPTPSVIRLYCVRHIPLAEAAAVSHTIESRAGRDPEQTVCVCPVSDEVLVERCIAGWKEIEYEVMRDSATATVSPYVIWRISIRSACIPETVHRCRTFPDAWAIKSIRCSVLLHLNIIN